MKNIFLSLIAVSGLLFTACETTERELENSFDPDNITLEVIQATEGSNVVTLKMSTDGVMGEWSYGFGSKVTDEVNVVYPYTGTFECTYTVYNQYIESDGSVTTGITKSVEVTVSDIVEAAAPEYEYLVGEELVSKSWEFAGSPGDGSSFCYMASKTNWEEMWWNWGNSVEFYDVYGYITFDLQGGMNLTYHDSASAAGVTGSFSFNSSFTTFYTSGDAMILGASTNYGELITTFEIIELTSDSFILYVSETPKGDSGWVWKFVPKE
ncbi:MAG: hypothetical protein SNG57_06535 [Rikenellaceae bacterium]